MATFYNSSDIKELPNAFKMFEHEVTLSLTMKMYEEDLEYVIENCVDIFKRLLSYIVFQLGSETAI